MRFLATSIALLISVSIFSQSRSKQLLHNIKIIEVESGATHSNRAILIQGDKILEIDVYDRVKNKVPSKNRIDGQGAYVIPGLWDMHVHLEGADLVEDNKALLPVFLAYGITTIRDCASDLGEQVLSWREDIENNKIVGPTIFTAGKKLEGKNSIWKGDLEIENEAELNQMLDLLDSYKVDFVKITENTLQGELFLKSVREAHKRGYRVSGHVPLDVTINELADAGYTSIEHATYLLRLGSDEQSIKNDLVSGKLSKGEAETRYTREFNQMRAFENYKQLALKGVYVCPTLIGGRQLAYLNETDHANDEFLKYLTERFVSNYDWRIQRMANDTDEQLQQRKERFHLLMKQIPLFQQAGLRIIAGSDAAALNTYVYPAESLLQELELFNEAGLTPLQILQSATLNSAAYFDLQNQTGSIMPGKTADLVLLKRSPLHDIQALREVQGVFTRGTFYSRSDLDQMLQQARETKINLDNNRK